MDQNKKCVILSQEEYDSLSDSQNIIHIRSTNSFYSEIERLEIKFYINNIKIIGNIRKRLSSIEKHLQERIIDFWKIQKEVYLKNEQSLIISIDKAKKEGYNSAYKEIANMSYWERRKFLKEWKQK